LFKIQPYLISFLLAFSISLSSKEEDQAINLIYQKIVALEQEIASLRSLVEENAYLIEKSQELQKQRYMDLDQRLHELKIQSNSEEEKLLSYEQEALIGPGPEILLYKEALELFQTGNYAESLENFRQLIIDFPEGEYAAEAYFWSGELFLSQLKLEDARENYLVVVNKYDQHPRAADSLFKLSEIEKKLFQLDASNNYLIDLINKYPDSGAAQLAKNTYELGEEKSNPKD